MASPLVSILMPAWQSQQFVAAAIGSVQAQTYSNWELIVCEDGSEDETLDEIHRVAHGDDRIRVVCGEHAGQAESLNRAVVCATGEYLARLDADDMDHPGRIAAQVTALQADRAKTHITCDMRHIDIEGEFLRTVIVGPMTVPSYLNGETGVCNASAVWRRMFHVEHGLSWRAEHDVSCDTDYNLQGIAAGGAWAFLDRPWYYQRRHPGQMTKRLGPQMTMKFQELLRLYHDGEYSND